MDVKDSIIRELIKVIADYDPPPRLGAILGSYGDTLDDDEVLDELERFNSNVVGFELARR